jgi:hypothetical protein
MGTPTALGHRMTRARPVTPEHRSPTRHATCSYLSPTNRQLDGWDMTDKREKMETGSDKRFVRRDEQGQSDESDDVGRSLNQDRRRDATTEVQKGQGDRGDRRTDS